VGVCQGSGDKRRVTREGRVRNLPSEKGKRVDRVTGDSERENKRMLGYWEDL